MDYKSILLAELKKADNYNLNTYPYSYQETLNDLNIYDFDEVALGDVVTRSQKAFEKYKEAPLYDRSEILIEASRLLKYYRNEMAEIICFEAKKPIKYAEQEVDRSIQTLKLSGIEASKLEGELINLDVAANGSGREAFTKLEPLGVVYAMTPFNFPLNLVIHKVGPALAAGNSIIVKPSEKTPFSAYFLKFLLEKAGLPEDLIQVVTGDGANVTDILLTFDEVKKLSFTGSVRVGKLIKNKVGLRKLTLELGSTSPVYVSKNNDSEKLDEIAEQIVNGAFSYNGQVCISTQKVYVDANIYESLIEKIVDKTKLLKFGDVTKYDTDYSDLIDELSQSRILEWINEAEKIGATILTGGQTVEGSIEPTVITNTRNDMKICSQEIFGPVLVVERINSEDIVGILNNSRFGLNVGVFTSDLSEALKISNKLDYGQVMVNDVPTLRFDHMPYNGRRDSGYGTEGIKYAIKEMSQLKMVSLRYE